MDRMDHMEPSTPTPLPQERPFERIALSSAELPRACWFWIPLTTGLIALPFLSVPMSAIVAMGGCWRYICLRHLRSAGVHDGMLELWRRVLGFWCITGLMLTGIRFVGAVAGLPEPWAEVAGYAWMAWCLSAVVEWLLATAWIARGCVARESGWAAGLVGVGLAASMVAIAVQVLGLQFPGKSVISVLLGGVGLVSGLAGPLLIADASARLLQSMASEQLDEESEQARGSGRRLSSR
jgi:hypothetical protein